MAKGKKTVGKSLRSKARPGPVPISPPRPATAAQATRPLVSRTVLISIGALLAGAAVLAAIVFWSQRGETILGRSAMPAAIAPARYIGGAECASCHAQESAAWKGSDHDLAMQIADEKTILGNFGDAKFTYAETTSTFFRRDGKYFVNTDGPDGKLADYEIKYTFGVRPLQQYLIAFPGGRMQALGIACQSGSKICDSGIHRAIRIDARLLLHDCIASGRRGRRGGVRDRRDRAERDHPRLHNLLSDAQQRRIQHDECPRDRPDDQEKANQSLQCAFHEMQFHPSRRRAGRIDLCASTPRPNLAAPDIGDLAGFVG